MSENQDQIDKLFTGQFTVRLSQDEMDYVNENTHLIRGDEASMSRSRFFVTAVTKAVQAVKPKTITVSDPADKELIETLTKLGNDQTELIKQLEAEKAQLIEQLQNKSELPKTAIVLEFEPKIRQYFWGIKEIAKKMNYAQTYEELIEKMLVLAHERNEFKLDQSDIDYLNTLEYEHE